MAAGSASCRKIPTGELRLFDLDRAAQADCDEVKPYSRSRACSNERRRTLQGHSPVHPAYDEAFDGFAPEQVRRNPQARQKWAVEQVLKGARASQNLGLKAHATFPGALAWPYLYPWPQRPAGLIEAAFDELARRWRPILDAFDAVGVDVAYEIHPGEDLFDAPRSALSPGDIPLDVTAVETSPWCATVEYLA